MKNPVSLSSLPLRVLNIQFWHWSYPTLMMCIALFWVLFANQSLFSAFVEIYPFSSNRGFFFAVAVLLFASILLLLSLLTFHRILKPTLILLLLVSASTAYFMDSYHTVIDDSMITNVVKTDLAEAMDLLSWKLALYLLLLGVLPSWFVLKVNLPHVSWKKAWLQRIGVFAGSLLIATAALFSYSDQFSSFIREHKSVRFFANPGYSLYSVGKFVGTAYASQTQTLQPIGLDAQQVGAEGERRKLVVMVVGETARAMNWQLNGYGRETTPQLAKIRAMGQLANFTDVTSCGTSTAISVPCMFSYLGEEDFSRSKAAAQENVLDILQRVGVNILWLDNNSDSKGVALRVPYQNFKSDRTNPICDIECRDHGMLAPLSEYVARLVSENNSGDILIVLHAMGNHGPAYYKRSPAAYKAFMPECETNELAQCNSEQLFNTYDNALRYTDDFLAKTIEWLQQYPQFETAMVYASDHGESLGEHGVYLHGLPNFMAPTEQRKVPAVVWMSDAQSDKFISAMSKQDSATSHDALFHSLLGLMDVKTQWYDASQDWFAK